MYMLCKYNSVVAERRGGEEGHKDSKDKQGMAIGG